MNLITEEMVNKAFENIEFCGIPDDEYIAKSLDEQATKKVQKLIDALEVARKDMVIWIGVSPNTLGSKITQANIELIDEALKEFHDE